jgi:pyruvate dehydrogenase phosphatase
MTSEEAILLVAAALEGEQGKVPKGDLAASIPFEHSQHRPYPAEDLPGTTALGRSGTWSFQDDHLSLHLIRNALGRGDGRERQRLLSMKDNGHRLFRDDITVTFVQCSKPRTEHLR